jgi:hypothetical protein
MDILGHGIVFHGWVSWVKNHIGLKAELAALAFSPQR